LGDDPADIDGEIRDHGLAGAASTDARGRSRSRSRDAQLVLELGTEIERVLAPHATQGATYALLDFPTYANIGDSAIWLAAWKSLNALTGRSPVHCGDTQIYDRDLLRRRLGGGTIFLSGGGSFGDLWGFLQRHRERVIADFPDNPIVLLPQSIHFDEQENLDRARAIFDRHSDLTLLLRDRPSHAIAEREFEAPSRLCPDMAFALGPLARPAAADRDALWLRRTDKESTAMAPQSGLESIDWTIERHPVEAYFHMLPGRLAR
jgi:exopolysaccharide biosynthesis predicted pyruvyltransferase EpsI